MGHTRKTGWFIYGWIWLVLWSCACGCDGQPQAGTRGIGVYPGRPAESGAPVPVPGGKAYRNLAFRRAAVQSSAADFDLTAQLLTDGIDAPGDSTFYSAWKSRGSEAEWVCIDLGARARVDAMAFSWANAPVSGRILYSDDRIHWKEICAVPEGGGFDRLEFRPVKGRYFQAELDRTADGNPFELREWEIFGRGGAAWEPKAAHSREASRQDLTGGAWRLQRASEVTASGETVSREGFDAEGWIPATVPGTVLASYVNIGAVPDPNFADNHLCISESYFHSDFWYRDTFDARIDTERQFLHFDGVNWKAEVFLNGRRLGRIESAFREEAFDVTGVLRNGRNDLAVRIFCNDHFGNVTVQDAFNSGKNGGLLGADNPTMHATVGWDWIPTVRGRSMGIYDDVYLTYTGPVTVEDPFVRTELPLPDTSYAHVYAQARLVNHADGRKPVPAHGGVHRGIVGAQQSPVLAGVEGVLHRHFAEMVVADDLDGQVVPAVPEDAGHVEDHLPEGAFDPAQALPVQEHLGLPVHPVEMQELPLRVDAGVERIPVPEVGMEVRLGNAQMVVGEVRIRDCAGVHITRQDGPGDRGGDPPSGIEPFPGDRFAGGRHLGGPLQAPGAARQVLAAIRPDRCLLRLPGHAAAAVDFPFAQFERFPVGRTVQLHFEISSFHRAELHPVETLPFRDGTNFFPKDFIVRTQDGSADGGVFPIENHGVHLGARSQIHAQPFPFAPPALPSTEETGSI